MKLSIIATHYLPHIGGLELATYHLANELVKINNEVHIITPYPDTANSKTSNITVHRHPINSYPDEPMVRSFIDGLRFFRKTVKTIKEVQPDIIHAQNITNSIPAYIAWKKYHIPYVICIHGNLELMGPFLPKILKRFWAKLPHIKSAAKIIVLTQEMRLRTEHELGRAAEVIPNGVNLNLFYPSSEKKNNTQNQSIITVSRIDDKKGLEYAIQSMSQIRTKYPHAKLKIVGDGEYRKYLEELTMNSGLSESIEFLGLIPNTEIPTHLRNADLFLLPSLFEGLPLTLLEAMACGLPVISTPVSIAPEIIKNWNNGIIVPFKSPDAIADAVITLLSNTKLRETYAENSATAAKETASWESIYEKYQTLYQSIINQN